jgi:integrase/recombinase XerD
VHHKLEEYLDNYLEVSKITEPQALHCFRPLSGGLANSVIKAMSPFDASRLVKRRLKAAGLGTHYSAHSFRATGITNFLENDGTLEAAQWIAGHADSRTTKLYDRRGQKVLLDVPNQT